MGLNRKERERHLAKRGTSITEDSEEDNKDEPLTQTEVIGSFKDSGLPEFLKGSWTNANKIVQLNGIGSFPNNDSRRIVISLSSALSHTVQIAGKKLACVDCPRYKECGICAHTLAVAHQLGMLSSYVELYKVPVERMVRTTIPNGAGKKDNERKSICKRKKNPHRDLSEYGDRIDVEASVESDSPYEVVFIAQTKATTCYGCKGRVRDKATDPPPPAPHNILLRHKDCRVYQRSGESKICITKTPEAVYYHPLRSCAPLATRDNIEIEEASKGRLLESNKQLLWREFGMSFEAPALSDQL